MKKLMLIFTIILVTAMVFVSCSDTPEAKEEEKTKTQEPKKEETKTPDRFPDAFNKKTFKLTKKTRETSTNEIYVSTDDKTVTVDMIVNNVPSSSSSEVTLSAETDKCTATTSDGTKYTFTAATDGTATSITIAVDSRTDSTLNGSYTTELKTSEAGLPLSIETYEALSDNKSTAARIVLCPIGIYYAMTSDTNPTAGTANWPKADEGLKDPYTLFIFDAVRKTETGFRFSIPGRVYTLDKEEGGYHLTISDNPTDMSYHLKLKDYDCSFMYDKNTERVSTYTEPPEPAS